MRLGCCEACACVSFCFETAQQTVAATILTLNQICSNPEAFQKTCILAESIIQGTNFYFHTNHLPDLVKVLNVAHSFDFYGFCRLPRYIFHAYTPERIDEVSMLEELETILCDNWHVGLPDQQGKNRDAAVRDFAKERLTNLLEEMLQFDYDARTEDEFKTLLHNWLVHYLEQNPLDDFDPYSINLRELKVRLKRIPFLDALDDWIFIGVDIACVPAFLQDWALIDLSHISREIGQIPVLSWLLQKSLDDWIRVVMCVGFVVQFTEAFRSLCVDPLDQPEKGNARWIMGAAAAEFLYNAAILKNKDLKIITFFAFFAKSLGLIQLLLEPKPAFFNDPQE